MSVMVSPAIHGGGGGGGGGGGFTASASPATVYGARSVNGVVSVMTETTTATATATGDVAPFTYAWSKLSGDAMWSITSPTAQTTRFAFEAVGPGESNVGTFRCTVTDRFGKTVNTNTVEANVSNFGGFA